MTHNITSDGSPTPRKGLFSSTSDDLRLDNSPDTVGMVVGSKQHFPLSKLNAYTSKNWRSEKQPLTSNVQGVKRPNSTSHDASIPLVTSGRGNHGMLPPQQQYFAHSSNPIAADGYKKLKTNTVLQREGSASVVDTLLQRLSDHSSPLEQHNRMFVGEISGSNLMMPKEYDTSSSSSNPITPATDVFVNTPVTESGGVLIDAAQLQALKNELMETRNEVVRMNQEIHTSHLTKSTLDHAIGQFPETDYNYYKGDVTEQTISQLQTKFNASTRPNHGRSDGWPLHEDALSEKSETKPFNNGQGIWSNVGRQHANLNNGVVPQQQYPPTINIWNADASRGFYNSDVGLGVHGFAHMQQPPRPSTGQSAYRGRNNYLNEPTHFPLDQGFRGGMSSQPPTRPGSSFDNPRYNQYPGSMSPAIQPMGMGPGGLFGNSSNAAPYQPRPIGTMGTRLSPEAAEFSVDAMTPSPWNSQVNSISFLEKPFANLRITQQPPSETGLMQFTTPEPTNYRRLLERNMNCNWKFIVDKITMNNDQQASIFLQQKLKVGTADQKYEIVEAIINEAFPLMINRFGNFLVQRCFEHGTAEQVVAIAGAIRGNVLTLSMDAFGCHVIQKAFDAVPEEYKATMVHELLRRIPETVIHRYACHVWQKLFELRWNDSPPQIMRYVNEALRGMWHEVALGETGSLVVQNIFENCLEEDKRPCIEEVLASIDVISHGQFGNWCIQHICEHGAPSDRSRAIEHIVRFATEYSMDQYASKVIEKCLKIGGSEFLDRYLDRVCEGRADRPRMPLIDIAGDQFGNYLIQYILSHSNAHHRELVATHVRKHMVSLRGSKYGSRVAMLCTNPAMTTRPGPPTGMQVNRYNSSNLHRGGGYNNGFR
ncbi:armadillo-type protein [Dendryphion nanum]|uniref:Armadillo-type protein n=1 Tax=Dendryphion nanum TaxID=256645 RepID=A0A9P9D4A2_9PLEO|nr:armadillo-type protein [Dendryphion nanum]